MNRLKREPSPYLQLHGENPIDWYPWGEEAFARTKALDRPIFLSIGYSTCHWCHVMNDESFQDEEVAEILNEHFVAVKVDREQHPDVDAVYMDYCVRTTGMGGWPLTVFLTPDLLPFYAGTYFPKKATLRRIGLIDVLQRIVEFWENDRSIIDEAAQRSIENLPEAGGALGEFVVEAALKAVENLKEEYDPEHGGFLPAPKFPQLQNLLLLLDAAADSSDHKTLHIAMHTLKSLLGKGTFDQVGGGMFRYSTDAQFKVPHFEKMLYDNAFLLYTLGEFYRFTKDRYFKHKAIQVFEYLEANLKGEDGGYFTAQDAGTKEGAFYLYTIGKLEEVLTPAELRLLAKYYEISADGNFEGKIHLFPKSSKAFWDLVSGKDREELEQIQSKLKRYRGKTRTAPFTDKKILVFANGLLLAGLAKAAFLDERIQNAADALYRYLRGIAASEELPGALIGGKVISKGHLDDYAYLAWGFFEYGVMKEGRERKEALEIALNLVNRANRLFYDEEAGGYYKIAADTILPTRPKEVFDGAIPQGNSVMSLVLFRLFQVTGDLELRRRLEQTLRGLAGVLKSDPEGAPLLVLVTSWYLGESWEVVLTGGEKDAGFLAQIRSEIQQNYLAGILFWFADGTCPEFGIEAGKPASELALYLCKGGTCSERINSEAEIRAALAKLFPGKFQQ